MTNVNEFETAYNVKVNKFFKVRTSDDFSFTIALRRFDLNVYRHPIITGEQDNVSRAEEKYFMDRVLRLHVRSAA